MTVGEEVDVELTGIIVGKDFGNEVAVGEIPRNVSIEKDISFMEMYLRGLRNVMDKSNVCSHLRTSRGSAVMADER